MHNTALIKLSNKRIMSPCVKWVVKMVDNLIKKDIEECADIVDSCLDNWKERMKQIDYCHVVKHLVENYSNKEVGRYVLFGRNLILECHIVEGAKNKKFISFHMIRKGDVKTQTLIEPNSKVLEMITLTEKDNKGKIQYMKTRI